MISIGRVDFQSHLLHACCKLVRNAAGRMAHKKGVVTQGGCQKMPFVQKVGSQRKHVGGLAWLPQLGGWKCCAEAVNTLLWPQSDFSKVVFIG